MKKYKNLGIYGGTFAPVHKGHVESAKAFARSGLIDTLFIMPAYLPPHKKLSFSDSPEARMEMLKIAFRDFYENSVDFQISDYEIKKENVSYTYDTVSHFIKLCEKLILLCGEDMFLSFDTWYRAPELMKTCEVAYIPRHNGHLKVLKDKADELYERYGLISHEINAAVVDISSSEIREKIKNGSDITDFVDADVEKYIKEKGLYDRFTES